MDWLLGTLAPYFLIGPVTSGVRLNTSSGVLEVKNYAGSALAVVRVGDAAAATDALNRQTADGRYLAKGAGSGAVLTTAVDFDFNANTWTTTQTIPVGAVVQSTDLRISTGFDAGVTIKVGYTSADAALMDVSMNVPQVSLPNEGVYTKRGYAKKATSAEAPLLTISGTPTVGAGTLVVTYTLPAA